MQKRPGGSGSTGYPGNGAWRRSLFRYPEAIAGRAGKSRGASWRLGYQKFLLGQHNYWINSLSNLKRWLYATVFACSSQPSQPYTTHLY